MSTPIKKYWFLLPFVITALLFYSLITFQKDNSFARFPLDEVFYVVSVDGLSIAVRQDKKDGTYDVPESDIKVTVKNGSIKVMWGEAELPGHYKKWSEWTRMNGEAGIVL